MNGFEKIIHMLRRDYYGGFFMILFELAAIIIGLFSVSKDKTTVFFLAYLFLDFILLSTDFYLRISFSGRVRKYSIFIATTNGLISLVELLVYYYFFFKIIRNRVIIKWMRFFRVAFVCVATLFIITQFSFLTKRYSYVANMITVLEFLFLLLPSFAYFYELFKNEPIKNLYAHRSFWIVTGIFFYAVISIPYYLLDRFVYFNYPDFDGILSLIFYYTPFTCNFIFLARAFLCKNTLTI